MGIEKTREESPSSLTPAMQVNHDHASLSRTKFSGSVVYTERKSRQNDDVWLCYWPFLTGIHKYLAIGYCSFT